MNIVRDRYNTRIDSAIVSSCVSNTLSSLLSKMSPKLDNSNPAYMIGHMITCILKKRPTALQIALGVLMKISTNLINQMHDYNYTCSYDEVLQFKTSAAISATKYKNLCAISDCSAGMIQTVVDNFDADISPQNG